MNNFTLMILAAGFGTRMKDLTQNIPKPLLKINNTSLLSNTLNFFEELGCNKFIINTHYLHSQISDHIYKNHFNKNVTISFEPEILDTGGGIKNANDYFDNKNILITNSDIYWKESNKKDVINFLNKINYVKNCLLLLSKKENTEGINRSTGDFMFKDNYLKRWVKNSPILYYAGLQILNPEVFLKFNDKKFSINKIWDDLINNNKLKGEIMNSTLIHIGDKSTFIKYN